MDVFIRVIKRGSLRLPVIALSLSLCTLALPCQDVFASVGNVTHSAERLQGGGTLLKARVLVPVPVETVWEAIHYEREHDPDLEYSKVITHLSDREAILEEKFIVLPVVRQATCRMLMTEIPNKSITYKMVSSDHFKAMEGSWVLTPSDGGKGTFIDLASRVELDIPVPQGIVDHVTARKLERRLTNVRAISIRFQQRGAYVK